MGDQEAQAELQEEWENLHLLLGTWMDMTEAIMKNWEFCEAGVTNIMVLLQTLRSRLDQPVSDSDSDLQSPETFNKENEDSLVDWAESLTQLSTMKTDLTQYIMADNVLLLPEQVEHLHCQWEELCFKVSLRKQEITDHLNAWIIFNEKNKELCDWLTQMENKWEHNSDLNIDEMVEKLKKDCMEEVNLFSENKTHLKQLGEQLITASNKTKEAEINDKLKDINAHWHHLFDHIQARVRKLKETLVTVQLLDKNMSNLRTWLSHIETELSKPVVYSVCHSDEIQKKLHEQQELQQDIEQHTETVVSVLTLCDVLLHDVDACGDDSEIASIQQTTCSLDRRWKNICAMSMERRMRIEDTWRLWCKFLDEYSHFEEWLKTAEVTAANPDSANVLYINAKEELKKFEVFQRQVQERLTHLELINKQYRRLSQENRTSASCKLQLMVQDGNQRWDCLQRRVAAVLRRLKHFTSQREDFEGSREGVLVWLTEMDLQLTNVEHFSQSHTEDKMRQLQVFQQEITFNTKKIDALIVFGENLIQKSSPLDAVLIEDELEELHSYCQEVFGRVARFHQRLVNTRQVQDEDRDLSDQEPGLTNSSSVNTRTSWTKVRRRKEEDEDSLSVGGVSAGRQAMCHLLVPPLQCSGRETPVSVDSIPLEWDHTVDVGGSSSHEEDEDATFFSALSVKLVPEPPCWSNPAPPQAACPPAETFISSSRSRPLHQQGYDQLMTDDRETISCVPKVKLIISDEEERTDDGLSSSNQQIRAGGVKLWEQKQAQVLEQWRKLSRDLCDVTSWLGRALPKLERLQQAPLPGSIRDMEISLRKLEEMQRNFNTYQCLMISVNLSARHFLQGDSVELEEALSSANHSWAQACGLLESWERRLQSAVLQCQEFQDALHLLLLWLPQAESKVCTVSSQQAVMEHRNMLMDVQEQLRTRLQQVLVLQDISSHLLLGNGGQESVETKEKVQLISSKLHLLQRRVAAALESEFQPGAVRQAAARRNGRRDSSAPQPFLHRVLWAVLHLLLLFFLLLVLIRLVPASDDDRSCSLSNNFARSFFPMLHYTNGPPPT